MNELINWLRFIIVWLELIQKNYKHAIFTETKEHVFLFLPFLSIFAYTLLRRFETTLKGDKNPHARKAILIISAVVVIIGLLMALMGYVISMGFRSAMEAAAG